MPKVHNHGPTERRGLDCPERIVGGKLRGYCMGWPDADILIVGADRPLVDNVPGKWDTARAKREIARLLRGLRGNNA